MKYYIVTLLYGKVVGIASFDDEEVRDRLAQRMRTGMREWSPYDDVQTHNEVN